MRTKIPREALLMLTLVLLAGNSAVFLLLAREEPAHVLTVSFLDVGQGDAILIEGPTGIELLIDGGKDRSVLRELPRVMGPLDRTIVAVLATHPDADHIGGLPDVLARYRVGTVLLPARGTDTPQALRFAEAISREQGAQGVLANAGLRLHLGGGAYADVLYPEEDAGSLRETNDASVMVRVVYGETEFLLTGDAPEWAEDRVVARYGDRLRSDVLKAGHHGSRTSTGEALLDAADPETVVVSAGRENPYGHPHEDVLSRVRASGAAVLSTIDLGTIVFTTDGTNLTTRSLDPGAH
ncbi:MAG TPA: MBL fold metallo-hydrolase [Candidatus Paceibacterota bacterium]|nr:MBL fold metallo-hydrolase [Candidatus Paceibacterota bacterium]